MKLIIHCPETKEKQKELARQVAVFHAEAVLDYINELPCSYGDKMRLIEEIRKEYEG